MGNQDRKIKESGFSDLEAEKISQLLSSLPRVEAPGDFGFKVKARIAEERPANKKPIWLPTALKAAAPLGLAVFVSGYFVVTSFYVADEAAPSQASVEMARPELVQPVSAPPTTERANQPLTAVPVPDPTKAVSSMPTREFAVKTPVKRSVTRKLAADSSDSGSYEEAASDARILSSGGDPATRPESVVKGTPAGEILTRIGVNALFGESGWKAESVSPNTAASRAGVKAGDVIESVDDQDMTDRGSVAKPAKGKKLRVKRDGKSVDIVIDP